MMEARRLVNRRVYISGPMSGLPAMNFPAFHEAAKALRVRGVLAVSPAEIKAKDESWESCMRADLAALCECEAVALLPGWENSRGAHLEVHVAHRLGMAVFSIDAVLRAIPDPAAAVSGVLA